MKVYVILMMSQPMRDIYINVESVWRSKEGAEHHLDDLHKETAEDRVMFSIVEKEVRYAD